tara:strand:- start:1538 stop:2452 length:915 start_codon:yes stop_codon:yes gene_type:complete
MKDKKIYIIGSGVIGKSLSVFLQQESKDVILIRGSVDNIPEIKTSITIVDQNNLVHKQNITITAFSNLTAINGIVLIATKSFANKYLSEKLKQINGDFSIVLLQNGLHVEKPFESFDKVYRCVLFSGGEVINNEKISFKMVASSPVGNIYGKNRGLDSIIKQISTPYFGFREEQDIIKHIWNKVIINCAFNSICPLLEVDNGIFYRNPRVARHAKIIIEECVALSKKLNIELNQNDIEEHLMLISKQSNGQLVSTYQDIQNKRKTEIESLNLEIARLANEIGVPELVTNTRLLGELIQLKSNIK